MATTVTVLGGGSSGVSGSSFNITTSVAVSAGQSIIVAIATAGLQTTVSSVADSAGNTYVRGPQSTTNPNCEIWWCRNPLALASGSTITVTWGGSVPGKAAFAYKLGATGKAVEVGPDTANASGTTYSTSTEYNNPVPAGTAIFAAAAGTATSGTISIGGNADWVSDFNGLATRLVAVSHGVLTAQANPLTATATFGASTTGAAVLAAFTTDSPAALPITELFEVADTNNTTSFTGTTRVHVDAHQSIILEITMGVTGLTVSSIVDSAGNTYSQAVHASTAGAPDVADVWHCLDPLELPAGSTITVTFSAANTRKAMVAYKLNGIGAQIDSGTGGATSSSGPAIANTSGSVPVGTLLFGAGTVNSATGPSSPPSSEWTQTVFGQFASRSQCFSYGTKAGGAGIATHSFSGFGTGTNWADAIVAYAPPTTGKVQAVGLATSVGTALTLTWKKVKGAGLSAEADTGFAVVAKKLRIRAVNQSTEADTGFGVARLKRRAAGLPLEADSSFSVTKRRTKFPGLSTEADVGFHPQPRRTRIIAPPPIEVDTANNVVRPGKMGVAVSSGQAFLVRPLKTRAVGGPVVTVSSAFKIFVVKSHVLLLTAETTSVAGPLVAKKQRALLLAAEADLTLALKRVKSHTLDVALEVDVAQTFSHMAEQAFEIDHAYSMRPAKSHRLAVAVEADEGLPMLRRLSRRGTIRFLRPGSTQSVYNSRTPNVQRWR